jgi:hypothetical protein
MARAPGEQGRPPPPTALRGGAGGGQGHPWGQRGGVETGDRGRDRRWGSALDGWGPRQGGMAGGGEERGGKGDSMRGKWGWEGPVGCAGAHMHTGNGSACILERANCVWCPVRKGGRTTPVHKATDTNTHRINDSCTPVPPGLRPGDNSTAGRSNACARMRSHSCLKSTTTPLTSTTTRPAPASTDSVRMSPATTGVGSGWHADEAGAPVGK